MRYGLFFVVLCGMVGCGPSGGRTNLQEVVNLYRSGQYQPAYDGAVRLAQAGTPQIDQAKYMAGMSAYHLGKDDEVMKYLDQLTSHTDPAISGPAGATVALIHVKYKRYSRALAHFEKAIPKLQGNDQANAYYHQAVTLQMLGRYNEAQPALILAAARATDPQLKAAAQQRMQTSGFTLQFGAYSRQSNAEERAREVGPQTRQAGVGTPQVLASDENGRRLYHVQAGRFATYQAAQDAREKVKRSDVTVVRISNP